MRVSRENRASSANSGSIPGSVSHFLAPEPVMMHFSLFLLPMAMAAIALAATPSPDACEARAPSMLQVGQTAKHEIVLSSVVYATPGKGKVWQDEGEDKGSVSFDKSTSPDDGTPGACAAACDSTPGCNGFAKCHGWRGTCWLKHKTFDGPIADEPTKNVWGCTSFYATGEDGAIVSLCAYAAVVDLAIVGRLRFSAGVQGFRVWDVFELPSTFKTFP